MIINRLNSDQLHLISEIKYFKALDLLCKIQDMRKKQIRCGKIKYSGCAVCGSKKHLQIHHLSYKDNQTMLLCHSCHERVHFGKGLEHLNPVGKKNWKNYVERMIISSDFTPCSKSEESDQVLKGYIKLYRTIFNICVIGDKPIDRVYRITN